MDKFKEHMDGGFHVDRVSVYTTDEIPENKIGFNYAKLNTTHMQQHEERKGNEQRDAKSK
jgi:hypothetical protein